MSEHRAVIEWKKETDLFTYESYNRDHAWKFENGITVAASAAPDFRGNPSRVDPESGFVASIASCHMLTFLAVCARKRLIVESYSDNAVGHLEKGPQGKLAIVSVDLHPHVEFGGETHPSGEELSQLHDRAHADCFIANFSDDFHRSPAPIESRQVTTLRGSRALSAQ